MAGTPGGNLFIMAKIFSFKLKCLVLFACVLCLLLILCLRLPRKKTKDTQLSYMPWFLSAPPRSISLFTLNIWFGNYKMKQRMAAIGKAVSELRPDIITFQEVTTFSLKLLANQEWFRLYKMVPDAIPQNEGYFVVILSKFEVIKWRSLPFKNSRMGRNLLIAELKAYSETSEGRNQIPGKVLQGPDNTGSNKSVSFTIANITFRKYGICHKRKRNTTSTVFENIVRIWRCLSNGGS